MAAKPKFTRIPKTTELIQAGVPAEAIGTYCCLADCANNKTGLCWPKMETLAQTLNRSVRTIQRHLHLLRELGLIEFVERRRHKGRFSSYLYRVLHIVRTTGHGKPVGSSRSNRRRTKQLRGEELNSYELPLNPHQNPSQMATGGCLARKHRPKHGKLMTLKPKNNERKRQNAAEKATSGSSDK